MAAAPPEDGRLRFQLLSDIHLEMRQGAGFAVPPRRAPYLALLGDIGAGYDVPGTATTCYDHLVAFVEACCGVFAQVWYVMGNHERYGKSLAEARSVLQAVERRLGRGKFALLDRSSVDVPGTPFRVLGCTLWTGVPEASKAECEMCLNDMRGAIGDVTTAKYHAMHAADVVWLAAELGRCSGGGDGGDAMKIAVVLTHHAPTLRRCYPPTAEAFHGAVVLGINGTQLIDVAGDAPDESWHKFVQNKPRSASDGATGGGFFSRGKPAPPPPPAAAPLAQFSRARQPSLAVWAYGHTHWNMNEVQGGVRLVTNQVGYPYPRDPNLNEDRHPGHVRADPGMVVRVFPDGASDVLPSAPA